MKKRQFSSAASKMLALSLGLITLLPSSACFFSLDRGDDLDPGDVVGRSTHDDDSAASFARLTVEGLAIAGTSRAEGDFKLSGLPLGKHRLNIREDRDGNGWPEFAAVIGFRIVEQTNSGELFGATTSRLSAVDLGDVVLSGTVSLSGQVVDDARNPFAGARVAVVHDDVTVLGVVDDIVTTNGEVEARVGTGADGRFIVPAVAAGRFTTFAYSQQNGALLMSDPVDVNRQQGEEVFEGDDALQLISRAGLVRDIRFDLVPAPSTTDDVRIAFSSASGFDGEAFERAAAFGADGWIVEDVAVGPWAFTVSSGATSSILTSRFILPGQGLFDIGSLRLSSVGCTDCDCDGDGIRGLPVLGAANDVCADVDGEAIWQVCTTQCAREGTNVPRECEFQGRLFDCEDDLDGQQDIEEPRECYGVGLGPDCDSDGICGLVDDDDRCPFGTVCDPADVVNVCGDRSASPPVDGGPEDAGVDSGPEDAGEDAGVDGGPEDAGEDAGVDGGPEDAGIDAGPFDGGSDAGPVDAGFDAGLDAGPVDAGPFDGGSDAGPIDAGFDAGQDAGVDVIIAPVDAGPPIPNGFVDSFVADWSPVSSVEVYFNRTATVYEGGDALIPGPCPVKKTAVSPSDLVVHFDTTGTCSFQLLFDNLANVPSIASGPDGGLYVAFSVEDVSFDQPLVVGQDSQGSDVEVQFGASAAIVVVHYDINGDVVAATALDVNGTGFAGELFLSSHPLNAGVTLAANIEAVDSTVTSVEFPSFAFVSTVNVDFMVVFLTSDLSPDAVIEGDTVDDASAHVVTALRSLTLTTAAIIGATSDVVFSGTPAALGPSSARAFLAEVDSRTGGFVRWSRFLAGPFPQFALGESLDTGAVVLALSDVTPTVHLSYNSREYYYGGLPLEGGNPVFSSDLPQPTPTMETRVLAYEANADGFLSFGINTSGEPAIFLIDPNTGEVTQEFPTAGTGVENITELEIAPTGDLFFVIETGGVATIWRDAVGSPDAVVVGSAAVGTDLAIVSNGAFLLYADDTGALIRRTIGAVMGPPQTLLASIANFTLASDGDTLVYTIDTDVFSTSASNFVANNLEVTLGAIANITDLAYDSVTNKAFILVDNTGVLEFVIGSGGAPPTRPMDGTNAATSVAVRRPKALALLDQAGVETSFEAPGLLRFIEIVDGEVTSIVSGGTVAQDTNGSIFPLAVRRVNDTYAFTGGAVDEAIAFANVVAGIDYVDADDFIGNQSFEVEAFAAMFDATGPTLRSMWIDQTETADFPLTDAPPSWVGVDGSTSITFAMPTEGRAGDISFSKPFTAGGSAQWRTVVGGSPPLPARTLSAPLSFRNQDTAVNEVIDVVMANDRIYMTAYVGRGVHFAGTACEWDNTQASFELANALFAFDGDANCLFLKGYTDAFEIEIAKRPNDAGVVLTVEAMTAFDSITGVTSSIPIPISDFGSLVEAFDRDGALESSALVTSNDGGLVFPFALADGAWGAAVQYNTETLIEVNGGALPSTTVAASSLLSIYAFVLERDGTKRGDLEFSIAGQNADQELTAVVGLGSQFLVAYSPGFGSHAGVPAMGNEAFLTRVDATGATFPRLSTSVIERGYVEQLVSSPGGTQVAARAVENGENATFIFPSGNNVTHTIADRLAQSFVVIFDRETSEILEIVYSNEAPSIVDVTIPSRDHINIALQAQNGAGITLSTVVNGGTAFSDAYTTNEAKAIVVRMEARTVSLPEISPPEFVLSQAVVANNPFGAGSMTKVHLTTIPYVDDVLFATSDNSQLNFEGTAIGDSGPVFELPIAVPIDIAGVVNR